MTFEVFTQDTFSTVLNVSTLVSILFMLSGAGAIFMEPSQNKWNISVALFGFIGAVVSFSLNFIMVEPSVTIDDVKLINHVDSPDSVLTEGMRQAEHVEQKTDSLYEYHGQAFNIDDCDAKIVDDNENASTREVGILCMVDGSIENIMQ